MPTLRDATRRLSALASALTLVGLAHSPRPALAQEKPSTAQQPAQRPTSKPAKPRPPLDAALAQASVQALSDCQALHSPKALRQRYQLWRAQLKELAQAHPQALHAWIIGAAPPPEVVMQETLAMRDCMLHQLLRDAALEDNALLLDLGEPPTKKTMRAWAQRLERSPKERQRLGRLLTTSHHRDADSQAFIWHRKFLFAHPQNFNLISSDAAQRCGLTRGGSWQPGSATHKRCWTQLLTPKQRQREILTASSAPGISRHHWGTELDLFNLNPRKYERGGPYADEYAWMQSHALRFGFFQPFTGPEALGEHTYIEERWHWSYYPIAQALHDLIHAQRDQVQTAMFAQWDRYEQRWSKGKLDFFSFVREHWLAYATNTARVELAALPWLPLHQAPLILYAALATDAEPPSLCRP